MGCIGFLKVLMFTFNGIIMLVGIAIVCLGTWVKLDGGSIFDLLQRIHDTPAGLNAGYLLMAIGAILLIIGSLGCCGAVKENRCLLLLFYIAILLVFIAEVAAAATIWVFQPFTTESMNKVGAEVVKGIKRDFGRNQAETTLWLSAMKALQCCGFYNYTDFTNSPYNTKVSDQYPPQCCATTDPCNSSVAASVSNTTVVGCFAKIKSLIHDNTTIVGAVALGIVAIELWAMILSMTLSRLIALQD